MLDALANNPLLQLLALAAAIAAAVWASNHGAHRQRAARVAGGAPLPHATAATALSIGAAQPPAVADDRWLVHLLHALHLLVIGHSQGGKTTLIHELATRLAAASVRVIVCDLDAAPGL